ncbi:MAG: serine hydrolase domain-containing protein [Pseudomonadota bacterium]
MGRFLCFFTTLWALLLGSGASAQEGGPTQLAPFATPEGLEQRKLAEINQTLQRAMETGDFVGLAVAVVRDDETVFLKTYGVTEVNGTAEVTPDTRFRIASLSKGFASSLVGLAVSEGRLSLDAPATDFAPDFALARNAERTLTLQHLLSHRTSLPPNAYDNLLEAGIPPDEILPQYRKVRPICPVGQCYAYQNIIFDIAGRAAAQAYGAPYPDLVRQRIFVPLNMTSASFGANALKANDDWARPHRRRRNRDRSAPPNPWQVVPVKPPYYSTPAAGGVNASIRDMSQWLKAQLGGAPEILSPSVLNLIHAPQVDTPAESRRMRSVMKNLRSSRYGLGWRLYDYAGTRVVSHSGSVDGYGAQIVFVPEENTGIIILSNARTRRLWSIAPMFLDLTLGQPRHDWLALEDAGSGAAGIQ